MKLIDIFSLCVLGLIFYIILGEDGMFKNSPKKEQAASPPPFYESTMDEGLPADYVPKDVSNFPSEEKLKSDLEYRKQRFEYAMKEELREINARPGNLEEKKAAIQGLIEKHQRAKEELERRHAQLYEDFRQRKDQEKYEDKGLR